MTPLGASLEKPLKRLSSEAVSSSGPMMINLEERFVCLRKMIGQQKFIIYLKFEKMTIISDNRLKLP